MKSLQTFEETLMLQNPLTEPYETPIEPLLKEPEATPPHIKAFHRPCPICS